MSAYLKIIAAILLCGSLAGCGLFDSGVFWRGGHYGLLFRSLSISICFHLWLKYWIRILVIYPHSCHPKPLRCGRAIVHSILMKRFTLNQKMVVEKEPAPMNPKMVKRTPHPGPLPIGSADSADAEREKRSQRLGEVLSRVVQGFNARIFRGILVPTLSPREKEIIVPASGKSGRPEFAPVRWLNGCRYRGIFSLAAPLVLLVFALWFLPNPLLGAEILWSNQLSQAKDLTGSSGTGDLVSNPGRGTVLHFSVAHTNESAARSFPLPLERLRNRFVFLDAEVKAADVGSKPNSWNGIKVMVHLETPAGSQWPQAELPTGTFDWQSCSHRFLVPPDTTAATLVLGMENVPGQAWIHDVRLVLGKE